MKPLIFGLTLAITAISMTHSSQADALFHSWRNIAYFNSNDEVIGYRVYTCSSTITPAAKHLTMRIQSLKTLMSAHLE